MPRPAHRRTTTAPLEHAHTGRGHPLCRVAHGSVCLAPVQPDKVPRRLVAFRLLTPAACLPCVAQKNDGRDNPTCEEAEDAYDTSEDEREVQIGGQGAGRRRPPPPAPVVALTAPQPAAVQLKADSPSAGADAMADEEEEAPALPVAGGPAAFTVKLPVPSAGRGRGIGRRIQARRGGWGAGRAGGRGGAAKGATSLGHVALSSLPRSLPAALRLEAAKWVESQATAPPYLTSVLPVVISLFAAYGADSFLTAPVSAEDGDAAADAQALTWASLRERMTDGKYDALGRNAFVGDLRRMLGQDMLAGAPMLHTISTHLADTDAAALEATALGREALAPRRFFSVVRGACSAVPVARDPAAEAEQAEKASSDAKARNIQAAIKRADDANQRVLAARHDPSAAEAVSDSEEAPDPNAAPEPRSTDHALLSPDGVTGGAGGGAAGRGGRGGRRGGRGGGRGKRARSDSDNDGAPAEEEPSDSWGGDA